MKVVALISGGKDSCFNILQCVAAGHEMVALANLLPESNLRDELDSYMYQTVGHRGVELYSEAMGLPLFRQRTSGRAIALDKLYAATPNDEVEDLYELLAKIKEQVDVEAVAVGAVLSDYQRLRVENVCGRLGLRSLAYLWRRDQSELLREMVACRVDAVIVKVAALGLRPDEHLGRRIQSLLPHLERMNEKYALNVCGEGGEYETFTLDCPLFAKAIVIDDYETVVHSNDAFAPVGYINFLGLHLVDKQMANGSTYTERLVGFPVKTPLDYIADIDEEEFANEDTELGTHNSSEESSTIDVESEPDDGGGGVGGTVRSSTDACGNKWCWVGGVVGAGTDSGSATASALATVCELLEREGLSCRDLVRVWMFVRDMADYPAINEAYVRVIEQMEPPVRVCVEAPLPSRFPVVIEATACAASGDRNTMHVQTISHWAPANIGPYSQAVRIGDIIYVAGQIPLVPGSMQLLEGEFRRHCRLALRHVDRVIRAMDADTQIRDVVQGVCYVTSSAYVAEARREWERCSHDAITDFVVVPALPRGALVEWQVWAHRRNGRFEYEETGRTVGACRVSLRRRWNHNNTVVAVVCNVAGDGEGELMSETELEEVLLFVMQRLHRGSESETATSGACALRLLRCVGRGPSSAVILSALSRLPYDTVQTVVPVCRLGRNDTFISLWGLRH